MINRLRVGAILAAALLLITTGATAQDPGETPTYSNAQVVSIDVARRVMVVRNSQGREESLVFDDLLAGTGSIKAGDRVILTVKGGPGRMRVTAISLARTTPPKARSKDVRRRPSSPSVRQADVSDRFSKQVAIISQDARPIDGLWNSFVTSCHPTHPATLSESRDWFGLWDGRVQWDSSGGFCRDLFTQIVDGGEGIKKAMIAAESETHGLLSPGSIREIRGLHGMNWDGWNLPPPQKRAP